MANIKSAINYLLLFGIFLFTVITFTLFSCHNLSAPSNKKNIENSDSSVIVPADIASRPNKNFNHKTLPHSDSLKIQLDTTQLSRPHLRYHERPFNRPKNDDSLIKKFDRIKEAKPLIKNHEIVFNKPPQHIDSSVAFDTVKQIANTNTDNDQLKISTTKRSAILGYSFFKNIQQHDTRNINAYVSVLNEINKVVDTLKQINANDVPQKSNDTATIAARNILLYKALDIQLLNAGDSDFVIKSLSDERQLIDSLDGNLWTWAVTPKTYKANGRLIMKVIAEKPNGSREPLPVINIPISITIDKSIFRSIWEWMMDNPEKVITIILIPLIVFFWKQIVGLFKKKPDGKN